MELHQHPELSGREKRTSGMMAREFKRAGLSVTEGVGGYGVVGVLANGDGPVVALRAEMDALPVAERTGVPYASTEVFRGPDGREVPVMHACGHDSHLAMLVGAARMLGKAKGTWRGTVVAVAQPAEETFEGAKAMLEDGLFTRFPRPDVMFAQHTISLPAGVIAHRKGPILSAAKTLEVRIFGRGGHGSAPHTAVDPVVIAAHVVVRLQSIVAREVDPVAPAVVTVGTFHAGTKANVIPEEVRLEVNVRSMSDAVQERVVAGIERIVRGECLAGGSPKPPTVRVREGTVVTYNDAMAVDMVVRGQSELFGPDSIVLMPEPNMASEDFAMYAKGGGGGEVPTVFWFLGCSSPERWDELSGSDRWEKLRELPGNHSPEYVVERKPTIRAGVGAFVAAALTQLPAA